MTQQQQYSGADRRPEEYQPSRAKIEALIDQGRKAARAHLSGTAAPMLFRAVDLARQFGDMELFLHAGREVIRGIVTPQHLGPRLGLARELFALPRGAAAGEDLAFFLAYSATNFLEDGDGEAAEEALTELMGLRSEAEPMAGLSGLYGELMGHFMAGRLEETAAGEERLLALGEQLGHPGFGLSLARRLPGQARLYLGRGEDALGLVQGNSENTGFRRLYLLAHTGHENEGRNYLRGFISQYQRAIAQGEFSTAMLASLLESAVLLGERGPAEFFLSHFIQAKSSALVGLWGFYPPANPARLLGDASVLLGEIPRARSHYLQAQDLVARVDCKPEASIVQLRLAQLLLVHYPTERSAAYSHLARAIQGFHEMKMAPYLEQALSIG